MLINEDVYLNFFPLRDFCGDLIIMNILWKLKTRGPQGGKFTHTHLFNSVIKFLVSESTSEIIHRLKTNSSKNRAWQSKMDSQVTLTESFWLVYV
jgi:hypothetical protein